jgi:uncharacterized membrane protein
MPGEPNLLLQWLIAGLVMMAADLAWISLAVKRIYGPMVQRIQGTPMRISMPAAGGAYGIMVASLLLVLWQTRDLPRTQAILVAAAWGLAIYGTYALTALAIFDRFTWKAAFADMLWGPLLYALCIAAARILSGR